MTDPLDVGPHEHGMTRIFVADADPGAAQTPMTNDEAAALLGTDVDPAKVEVVPAGSLAGMGLSGYLVDGYGVSEDEIAGDRQTLDSLDGQIVLVPSSAFRGETRIAPQSPLRFVGRYGEPPAPAHEVMTHTPSDDRPDEPRSTAPVEPTPTEPAPRKVPVGAIVVGAIVVAVILVLLF